MGRNAEKKMQKGSKKNHQPERVLVNGVELVGNQAHPTAGVALPKNIMKVKVQE